MTDDDSTSDSLILADESDLDSWCAMIHLLIDCKTNDSQYLMSICYYRIT